MLKFLHSIFGNSDTGGGYPQSLIHAAVERAVDGTDPWIRAVSGYQRRLRPAIVQSIRYVVELVDGLAAPIALAPQSYRDNPLLRTFFISSAEVRELVAKDGDLAGDLRGNAGVHSPVTALLVMEKRQRTILGAGLSGTVVQRDMPQTTVSFESTRLVDPSGHEIQTRHLLKRRAFDHLLSLALKSISFVKGERAELERRRALLEAKLNVLQGGGWGFHAPPGGEPVDITELEGKLAGIERQLAELGGDESLEVNLEIVIDLLSQPERHLWYRKEEVIIDGMGIKRNEVTSDAPALTLETIGNDLGLNLVVSLVAIPEAALR